MPIRLHPQTKDHTKLEKLAGVPCGTMQRLQEVQAKHKTERDTDRWKDFPAEYKFDREYEQWREIENDEDLAKLNELLVFGWGRFQVPGRLNPKCFGVDKGYYYLKPSGALYGDDAMLILQHNGIAASVEDIGGGVYWC